MSSPLGTLHLLLALTALLLCTATTSARDCPPQKFKNGSKCSLCRPGTYGPMPDQSGCYQCSTGRFQPAYGVRSFEACRRCYPGTFSDEKGSTKCKPCPAGLQSDYGSSKCVSCPKGSAFGCDLQEYSGDCVRNFKCEVCPAGTFSDMAGARSCESCPAGYTSDAGADECRPCVAGDQCFRFCYAGQFFDSQSQRCVPCPLGTTTKTGNNLVCKPCAKNSYRVNEDEDQCKPCPTGTSTSAQGAVICRRGNNPCPSDMFANNQGDCITCSPGYFRHIASKTCKRCASGFIGTGGIVGSCSKCPGRMSSNPDRTKCVCRVGHFFFKGRTCKKCRRKTVMRNDFHLDTNCQQCIGFNPPGQATCRRSACPYGKVIYAKDNGSLVCRLCPKGLMPALGRYNLEPVERPSGCVRPQTLCPPGVSRLDGVRGIVCDFFSVQGPGDAICKRDVAPADIGTKCSVCDPGHYYLDGEEPRCSFCSTNEVSPGGFVSKCEKCPSGYETNYNDESKCMCRGGGFINSEGQCVKCPLGTFSEGMDNKNCTPCRPGTESRQVPGRSSCFHCPGDKVTTSPGSVQCTTCPAGTVRISASRCL